MGKRARPLLYLLVGAAILAILVYWVNPSRLVASVARIPIAAVGAFVASVLGFHLLRSIRWRIILGAMRNDPPLKTVFWTNMIGYAVNSFIPVRFGGEVARAYIIDTKEGFGFFPSLSSVAVERILDLLVIVGLATLGALTYSASVLSPSTLAILVITGALTVAMFAVVLIGSRNLALAMGGFNWFFGKIPIKEAWREKILGVIESSLEGATAIGRNYRLLALSLVLSVLIWVVSFLGFYSFFVSLGLVSPASKILLGIMLFQLSFILPSAPGNVGSFEGFLVLVFAGLGLAQVDSTLAIGVVSHILNLLIIGTLGLAGVGALGLSMNDVFRIPTIRRRKKIDSQA